MKPMGTGGAAVVTQKHVGKSHTTELTRKIGKRKAIGRIRNGVNLTKFTSNNRRVLMTRGRIHGRPTGHTPETSTKIATTGTSS